MVMKVDKSNKSPHTGFVRCMKIILIVIHLFRKFPKSGIRNLKNKLKNYRLSLIYQVD